MSILGKEVSCEMLIGGTITEISSSTVLVAGTDGNEYEIRNLESYGGNENFCYETPSSIARRAAKTRKREEK